MRRMTPAEHLDVLRARQAEVDDTYPRSTDEWRNARHDVLQSYLAERLGDGFDYVTPEHSRYLAWLAKWDAETVAAVAALFDLAREHPSHD